MGGKEVTENLGEETNEMVAFRCLASLFDYSNSDAESKIEFDSSHSCQHVLQCILDEVTVTTCICLSTVLKIGLGRGANRV